MNQIDYSFEVDEWLRNEYRKKDTKSKPFIGERLYRHFDGQVSRVELDSGTAKLATALRNPSLLAKHSFLPFIRKDKKVRRFTKDRKTGLTKISQKLRPIMYASHHDAYILAFHAYLLKKLYEKRIAGTALTESVIAYRHIPREGTTRGKANIDFAKEVFEKTQAHQHVAVICLDIASFFDRMDHNLIEKRWSRLLGAAILPEGPAAVYKSVTRFRYVFSNECLEALGYGKVVKGKFIYRFKAKRSGKLCSAADYRKIIAAKSKKLIHKNKSPFGIPQGSPISDVIANVYMEDFDRAILDKLDDLEFGYYRRYSDDILLICPPGTAEAVYEFALERIKQERVQIKPSKTEAVLIDNTKHTVRDITYEITKLPEHENSRRQSFQYLGFEIDAKDLHIRSGTIANHYRRAKRRAKLVKIAAGSMTTPKQAMVKAHQKQKHKNRSRWQYFITTKRRVGSKRIDKQFKRALNRVKSFSSN
jgi:RNA-directed DNA polymerase